MGISLWEIEQRDDGTFDVFRDRRVIVYDRADLDEALDVIRRMEPDATEFTLIEIDGYRTPTPIPVARYR